jgi:hypothetical protein
VVSWAAATPAVAAAQDTTTRPSPASTAGAQTLDQRAALRRTPSARGARTTLCRGAPIPAGWILVDDMREPTMCGGTNVSALNSYNVWAIERYDNRPVGTVIEVCASVLTPEGWQLVDVFRDKEVCGHPGDVFVANVKRIRRIR